MNPVVGLVIASACDHYARVAMGGSKLPKHAPVYGLLFGIRAGSEVSICDSTEAIYDLNSPSGHVSFPAEQIEKKIALWTAVFTDYKLIGWYTFADEMQGEHLRIHKKYISLFSENPIFLLFDKNIISESSKFPFTAYVDEEVEGLSHIFVELPFHVQSSQIEKITMDTVMKSIPNDGLSELEVANKSSLSSLKQLEKRLALLTKTIQLMHDNKIPKNHQLIRKASKICKLLRVDQTPSSSSTVGKSDLSHQFDAQITSDLMTTFLTTVTKSNLALTEVAEVYALIYGDMQTNSMMTGGGF